MVAMKTWKHTWDTDCSNSSGWLLPGFRIFALAVNMMLHLRKRDDVENISSESNSHNIDWKSTENLKEEGWFKILVVVSYKYLVGVKRIFDLLWWDGVVLTYLATVKGISWKGHSRRNARQRDWCDTATTTTSLKMDAKVDCKPFQWN